MFHKILILVLIGLLIGLAGCAKTYVQGYIKPDLNVSDVKSIAMLPFDNISGYQDAGKKVENLLLTELVRTEMFKIAEMGEVEKSLRNLRIRTTSEIDLDKLQKLGKQLNVQAVIMGSVDEYELRQERNETVPVVSITARMLDVQTGDIIWAISHTHDGNDRETVFGFGKIISLSRLAQIVISEMVENLTHGLLPTNANLKTKNKENKTTGLPN